MIYWYNNSQYITSKNISHVHIDKLAVCVTAYYQVLSVPFITCNQHTPVFTFEVSFGDGSHLLAEVDQCLGLQWLQVILRQSHPQLLSLLHLLPRPTVLFVLCPLTVLRPWQSPRYPPKMYALVLVSSMILIHNGGHCCTCIVMVTTR